jgi:mono/diheme cytochrome c family protein
MRLRALISLLAAFGCQLALAAAVDAKSDTDQRALAQRLYREGIRASGEPLTGVGPAQARISGKDAACATCHRRSGYGTSEGRFTIRPIIGPALRQEQTVPVHRPRIKARIGVKQRPPYDEALLARAIRTGVDAAGQPLDPVMPRYALSDAEMKALTAYLFALSADPAPGVDEQEIHFATVIEPGVAPARRRAMLDVMEAFVRDKTANVRSDEQRREAGNMRMYRAYRRWKLHVWELQGPRDTWGAQLAAFYRQQPVFALIGGLGSDWGPVHEFSERMQLPSVLPQVDLPALSGANDYTFYFSRGVVLEADVLAKFLRELAPARKVVQVHRRDDVGAAAAAALRAALRGDGDERVDDIVLEGAADDVFWQRALAARPDALVLWLTVQDLERAPALRTDTDSAVYLSNALLQDKLPAAAKRLGGDVRLVYPSDLPPRHDTRLLRSRAWLHNKGLGIGDEPVQVNTLFALTVASDALGHLMDSFSRDYFVERVEHVVSQTPMASIFPSVSLGPGQRFAAKGSSVAQIVDLDRMQLKLLSGWVVP